VQTLHCEKYMAIGCPAAASAVTNDLLCCLDHVVQCKQAHSVCLSRCFEYLLCRPLRRFRIAMSALLFMAVIAGVNVVLLLTCWFVYPLSPRLKRKLVRKACIRVPQTHHFNPLLCNNLKQHHSFLSSLPED
jgi:hypothetical protein